MTSTIITISRQYGSGGREIGKKLADLLEIPFYDNELITIAAKKSGYAEGLFEQADQKPTGSLLYSLSMFGSNLASFDLPLNDKVFLIQSDIIREVAAKSGCVIVGRCADYVLRENPKCVNVFICGELEDRIQWAIRENDVEPEKAKDTVLKIDKRRATYYNYYTSMKFGNAANYHLCLNSSVLGREGSAEIIHQFVEKKDALEGLGRLGATGLKDKPPSFST